MPIDTFEHNLECLRRLHALVRQEGSLAPERLESLDEAEARFRAGLAEYHRLKALPFTPEVKARMDEVFRSLEDLTLEGRRLLNDVDPEERWGIRFVLP